MSSVEIFTKEQFEAALPTHNGTGEPLWSPCGLVKGEYTYEVRVFDDGQETNKRIFVRSSVRKNNISAGSGNDSIRAYCQYWFPKVNKWIALGKGDTTFRTHRTGDWRGRLTKKLRKLYLLALTDSRKSKAKVIPPPTQRQYKKANVAKASKLSDMVSDIIEKEERLEKEYGTLYTQSEVRDDDKRADTETKEALNETDIRGNNGTSDSGAEIQVLDSDQSSGSVFDFLQDGDRDDEGGIPSTDAETKSGSSVFEFLGDDDKRADDEVDSEPTSKDDASRAGAGDSSVQDLREPNTIVHTELNEFQQAIVDALGSGPQVIEACPGSGKTQTLESLVAAMIKSGIDASRIGVFTFSNSAASEARTRIAKTLWPNLTENQTLFFSDPFTNKNLVSETWVDKDEGRHMLVNWTCTIHALSFRLLKEFGEKVTVLSGKMEWQANNLIKDSLAEMKWKESPRAVRAYIGLAIRELITPGQAEVFYRQLLAGTDVAWRAGDLAEIYRRYYDFCKSRNLVDFDMMQARVVYRLRNDPAWRKKAQGKFDYILVDEAQDTSSQQAEILWALASGQGNVVFCGDVDQSMYKWRGARPEVLREDFEQAWTNFRSFNLPVNYRSTKAIISAAERLIQNNYNGPTDPYLKPFEARPDAPDGEQISYTEHLSFNGLCSEVVGLVKNNPADWFVLSRTRAECAAIHTELIRAKVPAINKSGGMLFGAPHIRKALAYARLACDYKDARDDLEILCEIANVASVEFRAPFTKRSHRDGCSNNRGWIDCGCSTVMVDGEDYVHSRFYGQKAIEDANGWNGVLEQRREKNRGGYPTTRAKGASDLVRFAYRLEKLKDDSRTCLNMILSDCVTPWLEAEYGLEDADLSENGKAEDLSLLLSMTKKDQSMTEYLDEINELMMGSDGAREDRAVILGTIHWSKGRETKSVIVNATRLPIVPPTCKAGKLPMGRPPSIEEERRLAYVAVTRAKEICHMIAAREWNGVEVPVSQFIAELAL